MTPEAAQAMRGMPMETSGAPVVDGNDYVGVLLGLLGWAAFFIALSPQRRRVWATAMLGFGVGAVFFGLYDGAASVMTTFGLRAVDPHSPDQTLVLGLHDAMHELVVALLAGGPVLFVALLLRAFAEAPSHADAAATLTEIDPTSSERSVEDEQ